VIRALLSLGSFVTATVLGSIISIAVWPFDKRGEIVFKVARIWARILMAAPGVKLRVVTRGKLDPSRPYVFMANHASMVDIWAMFVLLPTSFRFIAKRSLGNIPLFGWAMRAGKFIFIDRKNAVAARRTIELAVRRIRGGQSVVIYPEGTRTRDGSLGAFKKGGFHLAMDSGADIVPVAIQGSRGVMPPGAMLIRSGEVTLTIGEPIPTAGLTAADRGRLVEEVRSRIAEMLSGPPPAASVHDVQ
jgi:1-acyl-sn-glycerol-3-phosphate acyltransferase